MKRIFATAAVFLLAGLVVHADEPQKTGWPLTEAERAYVLKPEHERRPGVAQARWMCFSWAIASRRELAPVKGNPIHPNCNYC